MIHGFISQHFVILFLDTYKHCCNKNLYYCKAIFKIAVYASVPDFIEAYGQFSRMDFVLAKHVMSKSK